MKRLTIKGEQVTNIIEVSSDYVAGEHEVLIDKLPPLVLQEDEYAAVLYRDGQVVYEIKKRG